MGTRPWFEKIILLRGNLLMRTQDFSKQGGLSNGGLMISTSVEWAISNARNIVQ